MSKLSKLRRAVKEQSRLTIHGGRGSGRTLLMQSMQNSCNLLALLDRVLEYADFDHGHHCEDGRLSEDGNMCPKYDDRSKPCECGLDTLLGELWEVDPEEKSEPDRP